MNYGFIGCGNMAGAIVKGLLKSSYAVPEEIYVYEKNSVLQRERIDLLKINGCESYEDLIKNTDLLFLGVKPDVLPLVLNDISAILAKCSPMPVIISMAAGKTIKMLETQLNNSGVTYPIIRVMPSLNAEICESMTAICKNGAVDSERYEVVKGLFMSVGTLIELDENKFGIYTGIATSSPAFTYLYIDALAEAALKLGMNKKQALSIAAGAVLGSAKLVLNSNRHPWELIDNVCSPGGMTIEGICELQRGNFVTSIINAVEATVNKGDKIANS